MVGVVCMVGVVGAAAQVERRLSSAAGFPGGGGAAPTTGAVNRQPHPHLQLHAGEQATLTRDTVIEYRLLPITDSRVK